MTFFAFVVSYIRSEKRISQVVTARFYTKAGSFVAFIKSGVIILFDWIRVLTSGIADAISSGLSKSWEEISSSVWDRLMEWVYQSIYDTLADFFTQMSNMGVKLFNLSWVKAMVNLFSLFGWALFITGLVVTIFDIAIESQTGRVNIKTAFINVLKGFFAVNMFTIVPIELYKFCMSLQNTFSKDLSSALASQMGGATDISSAAGSVLNTMKDVNGLFNLISLIALGYCVVKIFFANIKRGGILLIQIAVGSLYLFSVPRGYTDGFSAWCKQIIALCLTAFLQTTLLFLGLLTWQTDMLLAIGIMMAANEVPRIAQNFGLDTSAKVSIMNAVHTTTTAVNLTKSIIR